MTLVKNKQTGTYKVNFQTPHGPKSLSTKTTNKKEAQKIVKDANVERLEQAAKAGKLTPEVIGMITAGRRVTTEQALAEWLKWRETVGHSVYTARNSKDTVNQFMDYCKVRSTPPAGLTEKHISDFINQPGEIKLGTRRSHHGTLVAFWDYLSAKGWAVGNPARLVAIRMDKLTHAQKEPKQLVPFTDEEVALMLKETKPGEFWHTAIAIGRYLGLRLGDVAKIEWDCFGEKGKVSVWTEKRDRRVSLPLEPKVLAQAIAAVPPNNSKFMFPEEAATASDINSRAQLSVYFGRIVKRLGIKGKSFHSLRFAYAKDCADRGIAIEHIKTNLGHASIRMTEHYIGKGKK